MSNISIDGMTTSTGTINSSGGAIQTNGTDRITNSGGGYFTSYLRRNGYDAVSHVAGVTSGTYSSGSSTITGTNYIRFGNGLQICWGSLTVTDNTTITLPAAFANAYYFAFITKTGTTSRGDYVGINSRTTTTFSFGDFMYGTASKTGCWVAIGAWKTSTSQTSY